MGTVKVIEQLPAFRSGLVCRVPLATGHSIEVQLVRFDERMFSPEHFAYAGLICPDSIARSVRKRQAEFFFGRLAASFAMARAGVAHAGAATQIGIGGSREPLWPAHVVGSISHTTGIAAAAVAPFGAWRGIGIDVEQIVTDETRTAVLELVLDAAETRMIEACPGPMSMNEKISLVFSAKESLFKAAFPSVRRYFDFRAARLASLDPEWGRLGLTLVEDLCPGFLIGNRFDLCFIRLEDGEILSVCAL